MKFGSISVFLTKNWNLHFAPVLHWVLSRFWDCNYQQKLQPTLCDSVALRLYLIFASSTKIWNLRFALVSHWVLLRYPNLTKTGTCTSCIFVLLAHWALICSWIFNQHMEPTLCAGVAFGIDLLLKF